MTFEKIVMTDSKTELLKSLLAIRLSDLPSKWVDAITADEIRIDDEVFCAFDLDPRNGGLTKSRVAEIRLRDAKCGGWRGTLKLRVIYMIGGYWKPSSLQLTEYLRGEAPARLQWRASDVLHGLPQKPPVAQEGELVDWHYRLYRMASDDSDLFAL